MLPALNEDGSLPAGIHVATVEEIADRFGWNSYRRRLLGGLKMMMRDLEAAGCTAIWIGGSFASDKERPGDYDVAWDTNGVDLSRLDPIFQNLTNERAAQKAVYGGEAFPADLPADRRGRTYLEFFQTDRDGVPRGIVKVLLSNGSP